MIYLSIGLTIFPIHIRTNIFHKHLLRADGDTHITRSAEDGAVDVAVVGGAVDVVWAGRARLRDFLIDNAIEFLMHEEMVMTVKDGGDVMGK